MVDRRSEARQAQRDSPDSVSNMSLDNIRNEGRDTVQDERRPTNVTVKSFRRASVGNEHFGFFAAAPTLPKKGQSTDPRAKRKVPFCSAV